MSCRIFILARRTNIHATFSPKLEIVNYIIICSTSSTSIICRIMTFCTYRVTTITKIHRGITIICIRTCLIASVVQIVIHITCHVLTTRTVDVRRLTGSTRFVTRSTRVAKSQLVLTHRAFLSANVVANSLVVDRGVAGMRTALCTGFQSCSLAQHTPFGTEFAESGGH